MHKLLLAISLLFAISVSSAGDTKGENPNPSVPFTKYPPGTPTPVPEPIRKLLPGERLANPEFNPFHRRGVFSYGSPKAVKFKKYSEPPETKPTSPNSNIEERWRKHHFDFVYPNGTAQSVTFPLDIFKELDSDRKPIFSEFTRGRQLVYGSEKNNTLASRDFEKRIIVGPDNRVEVFNTWPFPFDTVGRVGLGCTGTLVGPHHVLTAGHCVHSGGSSGSWFNDLDFTLTFRPYGTGIFTRRFAWSQVWSVTGWTQSNDPEYDYALIILADTTTKFPWMSFGYNSALKNGWIMNVNGFPGDKQNIANNTMWHSDGIITDATNTHFDHLADTMPGNSGSGVYAYWPDTNTRITYGVHVRGFAPSFNRATRINQVRFNLICSWINAGIC